MKEILNKIRVKRKRILKLMSKSYLLKSIKEKRIPKLMSKSYSNKVN